MNAERNLTRLIERLENEKSHLPYEWLKANPKDAHGFPNHHSDAEKATAARRREILDELKVVRAERKASVAEHRATREAAATANRARKQSEREAVTAECQICANLQCMDKRGGMVHHGYQRPGDGCILGDCFGVGYRPYPETDGLLEYAKRLVAEHRLAAMALDDAPLLTVLAFPYDTRIWGKAETPPYVWDQKMELKISALRRHWHAVCNEQVRVLARIKIAEVRL